LPAQCAGDAPAPPVPASEERSGEAAADGPLLDEGDLEAVGEVDRRTLALAGEEQARLDEAGRVAGIVDLDRQRTRRHRRRQRLEPGDAAGVAFVARQPAVGR